MKKILLAYVIMALIITACTPQQATPPIQPIQERVVEKIVVQCWDGSTAESIEKCPSQLQTKAEITKPKEEETPPVIETKPAVSEKNIMREILEKAPTQYWFVEEASQDTGAIVIGNKRSIGKYRYEFANVFWDTNTKELYLFTGGEISEDWWNKRKNTTSPIKTGLNTKKYLPAFFKFQLTGDKDKDNQILPKDKITKYFFIEDISQSTNVIPEFYVKSPIDWMREYLQETPIKIETSPQTLRLAKREVSSTLSIHFKHRTNPSKTIVFRFDQEFNLPLVIQEYQEYRLLDTKRFIFDTVWHDGLTKVPITQSLVELPKDFIVITFDDWQQYIEDKEN